MKNLSLFFHAFLFVAIICSCSSKEKKSVPSDTTSALEYVIHGEIDNPEIDACYVYIDNKKSQKVDVVDGKFTLRGTIDQPRLAVFGNQDKKLVQSLILDKGEFTFVVEKDICFIKGDGLQDEVLGFVSTPDYIALNKQLNDVMEKTLTGVKKTDFDAINAARDAMAPIEEKLIAVEDNALAQVINYGSSPYAKLFALLENYDWKQFPVKRRFDLLDEIEKEIGAHPDLTKYRAHLKKDEEDSKKGEKVTPGNPFINVIGIDREKNEVDLAKIVAANKFTLLEFWASWCAPCRAEIPNLKNAYAQYKDQGLEIVSFSVDSAEKPWLKAMDVETPTWFNGLLDGGFKNKFAQEYGLTGIPASFLIMTDGTIIAHNEDLRGENLARTLAAAFE